MPESRVQEYFLKSYHHGAPTEDADIVGSSGIRGQGPYLTLYLKLDDVPQESGERRRVVASAHYTTYACPNAIACGSWMCQWAEGRDRDTLSRLEPGDLIMVLGGLALGKEHCASLAVGALQDALRRWAEGEGT